MKIAVCQIDSIIGDLEYNKNKILEGYKRGIEDGADLVVCPELSLVGYPPLDLVEKEEFRNAVNTAAYEIASQTNSTGLIFGSITEDNDRIGTDVHNSAILCYGGKIQFVQAKSLIPNYDVFDEMRYFDPAKSVELHEFKGEKLGISVCEDIWNDEDYWYRRRYNFDPVKEQINMGATVLLNISSSPYSFGKREDRRKMLSLLTENEKIPLAYVCCVGAQTELIFDGASMCFNNKGELIKLGKAYEEDYFIFDTEVKNGKVSKVEKEFPEEVLEALIYGVKEYCEKLKFKKLLVGLSGGIDSALVTYIAVQALGKENVHVLLMPSEFSTEGSISHSQKLIDNLGISQNNVSIQPVFKKILEQFSNNISVISRKMLRKKIFRQELEAFI